MRKFKKPVFAVILLILGIGLFSVFNTNAQASIGVGDMVPSFKLDDQFGKEFNIDDHLGSSAMVIYFYPKDDTPGCTKEACSFRDAYESFTDKNIKVVGISGDDVESHRNFAEKYNLPFTLLADTENKVRELFGVKPNVLGLIPGRVTYVVDQQGKIIFVYDSQFKATKHIEASINALESAGVE